jgi:hypothetical protein
MADIGYPIPADQEHRLEHFRHGVERLRLNGRLTRAGPGSRVYLRFGDQFFWSYELDHIEPGYGPGGDPNLDPPKYWLVLRSGSGRAEAITVSDMPGYGRWRQNIRYLKPGATAFDPTRI